MPITLGLFEGLLFWQFINILPDKPAEAHTVAMQIATTATSKCIWPVKDGNHFQKHGNVN